MLRMPETGYDLLLTTIWTREQCFIQLTCALIVMSSRCWRSKWSIASMASFSQGSEIPAPSTTWILQNILKTLWRKLNNTLEREAYQLPAKRIPEARHSKTLRRASPGPMGRFPVPMDFSQMSSRGYRAGHIHTFICHKYLVTTLKTSDL